MRYLIAIVIATLLIVLNTVVAQNIPVLDHFVATKKTGYIELNWTLSTGSSCNGITVYRSVDSSLFINIGRIQGVCGSGTFPVPYDFIDTSAPKNVRNYYRLEFGGLGYSSIISIDNVEITEKESQVLPNPITTTGKILFYNPTEAEHYLQLISLRGETVQTITTSDYYFTINSELLPSGCYSFLIVSSPLQTVITRGFFVVNH